MDFDVDDQPVEISCDLGYRDTTAFWFWQPKHGGFDVVDYDQGIGMDADDWIDRLRASPYRIKRIWLPHDARNKTFQSKHSAMERFLSAFGADRIAIVPQGKIPDRVNAARRVIEHVRFHATNCEAGLSGLRSWSYDWDDEKRIRSKEPRHDWASHPGDAFSYGAQVLEELMKAAVVTPLPIRGVTVGQSAVSLDEMWRTAPRSSRRI